MVESVLGASSIIKGNSRALGIVTLTGTRFHTRGLLIKAAGCLGNPSLSPLLATALSLLLFSAPAPAADRALFPESLLPSASETLSRLRRDSGSHHSHAHGYTHDSKERLDNQIYHLVTHLPGQIDDAKAVIEADLQKKVLLRVTQGWSIVIASWKDIISDYVSNNRSTSDFGGPATLYKYGFLSTYGVGFGFPLLLGLPDDTLSCDSYDFVKLAEDYGLSYGVASYFPSHNHALDNSLGSRVSEFDLIAHAKLDCVLSHADNHQEAAEVQWALDELVAALNLRLKYEDH